MTGEIAKTSNAKSKIFISIQTQPQKFLQSVGRSVNFSRLHIRIECERNSFVVLCRKNKRFELSVLNQRKPAGLIFNLLKWAALGLLLLSSVAGARPVQTINSEAQL